MLRPGHESVRSWAPGDQCAIGVFFQEMNIYVFSNHLRCWWCLGNRSSGMRGPEKPPTCEWPWDLCAMMGCHSRD